MDAPRGYVAWPDRLLGPGREAVAGGGDRTDLERLSAAFVHTWDRPGTSRHQAPAR